MVAPAFSPPDTLYSSTLKTYIKPRQAGAETQICSAVPCYFRMVLLAQPRRVCLFVREDDRFSSRDLEFQARVAAGHG
jgi:hypothetical protein